jgi:hypothetical protein
VAVATLAIMTTQYCPASSIDGLIADSENSLSWLFQFSEPSGMEDESYNTLPTSWSDVIDAPRTTASQFAPTQLNYEEAGRHSATPRAAAAAPSGLYQP